MLVVFNIVIVGLVLLVGYWWANQGVFSALLHLLCVIVAGALAFAFWEPITVGLLLRGSNFDVFAWGVTLVVFFAVALFVLRLATNRLIPANLNLPHWANLIFGFPLGLAAGVLSIGIAVIGSGFIQSQSVILGYSGVTRTQANAGVISHDGGAMWLPVHTWTVDFYSWLSVTSMSTSQPMRHYYPALDRQAVSTFRDTYLNGRGQVTLRPSAARVNWVIICEEQGFQKCAISVSFNSQALDFGEQLTLSSSQVRLVGPATGRQKPVVAHPVQWTQAVQGGVVGTFRFDERSHYLTSISGQEAADVVIEFDWTAGSPRSIRIKGTRFLLPATESIGRSAFMSRAGTPATSTAAAPADSGGGAQFGPNDIVVNNGIRPIAATSNTLRGVSVDGNRMITDGDDTWVKGGQRPGRTLRLLGIQEPANARIVQVIVSRGTPGDVFHPSVRARVTGELTLRLVDSAGSTYTPIGYLHQFSNGNARIVVDRGNRIGTINHPKFPSLPASGSEQLRLLFLVTEGVTIERFMLGDATVATCSLVIPAG